MQWRKECFGITHLYVTKNGNGMDGITPGGQCIMKPRQRLTAEEVTTK